MRLQRRDNAINWIYQVRSTHDRKTTMKKLRSLIVGIDSGDEVLFKDGGEMWTGRGQRERRRRIKFSEKYLNVPNVQLSISLWDMDAGSVLRADVTAEAVTEKGFDMVFRTWGDTKVARIRISWTAMGELEDADAWDVG
jgi:hypothetical protein|tara:strand:+ start:196 stop:612 length:417 start_codon:yes stop_codon:yes gene_type:complete